MPQSGIQHMRIPVEDVDYADLLIHLPSAVEFINRALRDGGVILVHCVQGISRSAAVIAAYGTYSLRFVYVFPQSYMIFRSDVGSPDKFYPGLGICQIKWVPYFRSMLGALTVLSHSVREQIWPNPGFQEQLVLFELCQYAPSPSNGIYVQWRTNLDRRLRAAGLRWVLAHQLIRFLFAVLLANNSLQILSSFFQFYFLNKIVQNETSLVPLPSSPFNIFLSFVNRFFYFQILNCGFESFRPSLALSLYPSFQSNFTFELILG